MCWISTDFEKSDNYLATVNHSRTVGTLADIYTHRDFSGQIWHEYRLPASLCLLKAWQVNVAEGF
jgi:hypothetical protein